MDDSAKLDFVGRPLSEVRDYLDSNSLAYHVDITLAPHFRHEEHDVYIVIRQQVAADGKYYLVCGVKMGKEVSIDNGL